MSTIFGTSARDNIVGTADHDFIFVHQGARDTVAGLEGDDYIDFGAELNENDQVDGGIGHDKIVLEGNYFGGLVFAATTLVNCEEIFLEEGFSYNLTLDDATAGGDFFFINGNALLGGGESGLQLAEAIIAYREEQLYGMESIADVLQSGGMSVATFKQVADLIAVRSDVYTIRCVATGTRAAGDGMSIRTETVVDRSSTPYVTLYWYQGANN